MPRSRPCPGCGRSFTPAAPRQQRCGWCWLHRAAPPPDGPAELARKLGPVRRVTRVADGAVLAELRGALAAEGLVQLRAWCAAFPGELLGLEWLSARGWVRFVTLAAPGRVTQ